MSVHFSTNYLVPLTFVSNWATSVFFVNSCTAWNSQRTLGPNTLLIAFDAVTIFTQAGTVHR